MQSDLFATFKLGSLTLANRMVMAPMTRNRAVPSGEASPLMATYYGQRADAGLIISESVPVSAQGVGYPCTPGLFTDVQVEGWRRITDAVHASKGLVFAQLQHCGRVSHPSMQPNHAVPVAPSALKPDGQAVTYTGPQDYRLLRSCFDGVYVANNGYDLEQAQNAIQSGAADLVAFGLPFLANPDLVHRFKNKLPLNEPDQATFYGGGAQGYIDYPLHDALSGA